MSSRIVPEVQAVDDDDVVIALETARVSEERRDIDAAVKWLQRAASAARKQGRPDRAGVLSRAAAQLAGTTDRFERRPDESQTLGELTDDDFSDSTIVDSADSIAARSETTDEQETLQAPPVDEAAESSDSVAPEGADLESVRLPGPTPVAPLFQRSSSPAHQAIRVAVKRLLGGRFEARPLKPGENLATGEHEALLVPVASDTKL